MRVWQFMCLAGLIALAMGGAPRAEKGDRLYKLDTGPKQIRSVAKHVLTDTKRNKDLELRITYPSTGGPYPLIILSHGATGSKDAYQPLIRHWASHGYVCIQPTHGDSFRLGGRIRDKASIARHWRSRPEDVSLIIDSIKSIESNVKGLAGRINHRKIGVGGHSYGALTSQMLAGAKLYGPRGRNLTLKDDRPTAFVIISPQGPGGLFRNESYTSMDRPALFITGTHDGSPYNDHEGKWRRIAFDQARPPDKYLLWIEDAYHGFGGIAGPVRYPTSGPMRNDHVNYVRTSSLAFWDAYLKEDADAKKYLKGSAIGRLTDGNAKITIKDSRKSARSDR